MQISPCFHLHLSSWWVVVWWSFYWVCTFELWRIWDPWRYLDSAWSWTRFVVHMDIQTCICQSQWTMFSYLEQISSLILSCWVSFHCIQNVQSNYLSASTRLTLWSVAWVKKNTSNQSFQLLSYLIQFPLFVFEHWVFCFCTWTSSFWRRIHNMCLKQRRRHLSRLMCFHCWYHKVW